MNQAWVRCLLGRCLLFGASLMKLIYKAQEPSGKLTKSHGKWSIYRWFTYIQTVLLPSGKLTIENHHFQCVKQLFLWPMFYISWWVYQRLQLYLHCDVHRLGVKDFSWFRRAKGLHIQETKRPHITKLSPHLMAKLVQITMVYHVHFLS